MLQARSHPMLQNMLSLWQKFTTPIIPHADKTRQQEARRVAAIALSASAMMVGWSFIFIFAASRPLLTLTVGLVTLATLGAYWLSRIGYEKFAPPLLVISHLAGTFGVSFIIDLPYIPIVGILSVFIGSLFWKPRTLGLYTATWVILTVGRDAALRTLPFYAMSTVFLEISLAVSVCALVAKQRQAEKSQRTSLGLYDKVTEAARDLILIHDLDGHILYINKFGLMLLGYEPAQIIGKRIHEFVPPELHEDLHARAARRLAGYQEQFSYEAPLISARGAAIPFDMTSALVQPDEHTTAVLLIARDITERKQLQKERANRYETRQAQQKILVELANHEALVQGDLSRALRLLCERTAGHMEVERVGVWFFAEEGTALRCANVFIRHPGMHREGEKLLTAKYPAYLAAIRTGWVVDAHHALTDPRTTELAHDYFIPLKINAVLSAGIFLEGDVVGVLSFEHLNMPRVWSVDEIGFAGEITQQIGRVMLNQQRMRAERDRQEMEERYRALFERSRDGVFVFSPQGQFLDANPAALEMTGYAVEDIPHVTFPSLIGEDQLPMLADRLQEILTHGQQLSPSVFQIHTKGGDTIFVETLSSALYKEGELWAIQGIARDVTQRMQATADITEQNAKLEALNQIALVVGSTLDLEEVLRNLLNELDQLVPYDSAIIVLQKDGRPVFRYEQGHPTFDIDDFNAKIGHMASIQKVLQTRQVVVVDDTASDPHWLGVVGAEAVRSWIGVPLLYHDELLGVLNIDKNEPHFYTPTHIKYAEAVARQAAIAIAHAQFFDTLRSSEARFRTLFEKAADAMFLFDDDYAIFDLNQAACRMTGLSYEQAQGLTLSALLSPVAANSETLRIIAQKRPARLPLVLESTIERRSDSVPVQVDLSLSQLEWQGQLVTLGIARNIDDRKQAAQRQFELAVQQERVRILANFMLNAAQEFRTPLTIIQNNAYLLDKVEALEARQRAVNAIYDQIDSITRMVDNLVMLTRLDSVSRLQRDSIQFNHLLAAAATALSNEAAQKSITLQVELDPDLPELPGSVLELNDALRHLVQNAIRFTPAGGTVTLRSSHNPEFIYITVRDTGIGIAPDDLNHVFDRFYRVDKALSTRGFGLGLSIVRRVVELHGGVVHVESQIGAGTVFRMTFPLA